MSDEPEHLVAVAIRRDGTIHRCLTKGSHWEIRADLGDVEPSRTKPGDTDGFLTSGGRFVGRREANEIAAACGQCQPLQRDMLSSDIEWDGWKAKHRMRVRARSAPRRKLFRV